MPAFGRPGPLKSTAMSKIIGVAGLGLGACFLTVGAGTLAEQISNRAPKPISYAQFSAQKPTSGNYRISGATLCVADALLIENKLTGKTGNVYIPARAAKSAEADSLSEKSVFLLVRVDDPKIAATIREMQSLPDEKTPEGAVKSLQWLVNNQNKIYVARTFEGTLADGADGLDDEEKDLIESSDTKLEKPFVILQENTDPQFGFSLFSLTIGAGLCVWGIARMRGRAGHL